MQLLTIVIILAAIVFSLRSERRAHFLRAGILLMALSLVINFPSVHYSRTALQLEIAREWWEQGLMLLGLACYFTAFIRKEPFQARRWLWDRSYAE